MKFTESAFEEEVIEWIKNNNFRYYSSEEIYYLRNQNLNEVILEEQLLNFLLQNNDITKNMAYAALRKIKDLKGNDHITSNIQFQKYLIDGIKINDKTKGKYVTIKLFSDVVNKNQFIVTNQFLMKTSHPNYEKQKPDVVLFMNGLPIVVIELKSPSDESDDTIERAYQQIENYKMYLHDLFIFNVFNVISDGHNYKFGSLTSSLARYQNWRGQKFSDSRKQLFIDLLHPKQLLNIINRFIFFTNEVKPRKIIAGYHQYYGVQAAQKQVLKGMESNKKGGVFWHTQGSGKSFSMLFLVKNIAMEKLGTTFIVITDRNDLDDQLCSTFQNASKYIGQNIKQFHKISDLKNILKDRKQDGVYFSTIQKFQENIGVLINRENVVVIADEAHRSHNNIYGKFQIDVDNNSVLQKFGSAKYLRSAFPNATFIGFTGTPISNEDKSTINIFGDIVSEYRMIEAENDGVIVPIDYESNKAELYFDEQALKILDQEDEAINQKLKLYSTLPTEIKKKINKTIKRLSNFIADKDRIQGVVQNFISHYETRKNIVKGKAMFVTLNRKVAYDYYKEILKHKPQWKDKVKLVMTSNEQNDLPELIEAAGSNKYRKELAREFKNPNSQFKIAIVVDMWSTGFDVESLDTLYLDKPLKMHNLMQTIARTNRVFYNKLEGIKKESGLVVDYIGIWKKLCEALAFYAGNKDTTNIIETSDLYELKKQYIKILEEVINNFFQKMNLDFMKAFHNGKYAFHLIDQMANSLLMAKQQNQYVNAAKVLNIYFKKIISVLDKNYIMKFQILISVRHRLIKLAMDDIDFIATKKSLMQKFEEALKFNKTIAINNKKNVKITLSDILKFIELDIKDNAELSLREKISAIRLLIQEVRKVNMIRASKLSDDLRTIMGKYDTMHMTSKELLDFLLKIKIEGEDALNNKDDLSSQEKSFFEIIENPVKQTNFDKNKIKLIFDEILTIINNDKNVNQEWEYNKTKIKKTRGLLSLILRKHNYPPEYVNVTKNKIIDQIMLLKEYK